MFIDAFPETGTPIPMLKIRSIFVSSCRNYFIRKSEMSSKTRRFIYPYEKD